VRILYEQSNKQAKRGNIVRLNNNNWTDEKTNPSIN